MKHLKLAIARAGLCGVMGGALFLLGGVRCTFAADFTVTSPGFFYSINGMSPDPTLTLLRGHTYTFEVSTASFHPFEITNAPNGSVTGNNTSSGTITFSVPANAPNTVGYQCSIHNFGGTFDIVDAAPPPPTIRIVGVSVGSTVVLTSTGTNGWTVMPEFKTDATSTNWFALTIQTNTFANGTNETICGKPPGDTVLTRIKSQPQ